MAAVVALWQALGSDEAGVKPVNVTVDYMRGGRDKPTYARGKVTRLGTRVANVEAIAWQDEPDRPIAAARMNYLIVR
jgi:acyl-coenzyme A thioesterase PaaI-like protein